ncbi:MAG: MFS transporter [Candidatus Anammoximicrobium sp.]|nr:MFS transporter [Candidatus Anammoximicrobium sp.]
MSHEPRRGSLLVIFLAVFIDLLGFGIVLPLVPIYAADFAEDPHGWRLGLLMASFSIMQFVFAPIWGRISDHWGRRPVLIVGLLGSVLFYTLFGVATVMKSLALLFVARIGAGIAGATIPTAQAYIADSTSLENRPKGMALIGMAFGLGFTFGPLVAYLAVPSGHGDPGPWPGYAAAILSALALLLAIFKLPESKHAHSESAARRIWDWRTFHAALVQPSIGLLLAGVFVCVFSFATYETTLSMLVKGGDAAAQMPFHFSFRQVCLTYAYIGLTLALVQGGVVRRLAGRVSEAGLSVSGAVIETMGYGLMVVAVWQQSIGLVLGAAALVVGGFALMHPSLNSLLSRRSDPQQQGAILGLGQSVSALARILGSGVGIPLLRQRLEMPYYVSAGMMVVGLVLLVAAARRGRDYGTTA